MVSESDLLMNKKILYTIVIIVGFIVGAYLLWRLPEWYFADWAAALSPNELLKLQNELRATIVQAFGGAALLIGLFFTWRNIKATEVNLRIAQETTARTLELTKEGQITERFSRAIEQLGKSDLPGQSSNLALRIGGIYSLERIANDSERDYWSIMEVLTTYIRDRVGMRTADRLELRKKELGRESEFGKPRDFPLDLAAALTVIGRRSRSYEKGEQYRLDLSYLDLQQASLSNSHFEGADFSETYFENVRLENAHLEKTIFRGVTLRNAFFNRSHLQGANFSGAKLDKTSFFLTHLEGADFTGVLGLSEQVLENAHIDGSTKLPPEFDAWRKTRSNP